MPKGEYRSVVSVLAAQIAFAQGDPNGASMALDQSHLDRSPEQLRLDFNRNETPLQYLQATLLLVKTLPQDGGERRRWFDLAEKTYSSNLSELIRLWPAEYLLSANYLRELVGIAAATGDTMQLVRRVLRSNSQNCSNSFGPPRRWA